MLPDLFSKIVNTWKVKANLVSRMEKKVAKLELNLSFQLTTHPNQSFCIVLFCPGDTFRAISCQLFVSFAFSTILLVFITHNHKTQCVIYRLLLKFVKRMENAGELQRKPADLPYISEHALKLIVIFMIAHKHEYNKLFDTIHLSFHIKTNVHRTSYTMA